MEMIPVSSSNLSSVGYNPDTGDLYIRFHNGGLYVYEMVPPNVYRELMNASSHGKYFAAYIKNVYRYRKMN